MLGEPAMWSFQNLYCFWKNPAITARQHKVILMMIQALALGLMLGIVSRAAWDHGIVVSIALGLRDLCAAVGRMLRDVAAACWDFLQFIVSSRRN